MATKPAKTKSKLKPKAPKGKPKKSKRTPESPWFIVAIVLGTLLFTAVLALAFLAGRSSRSTPSLIWPQNAENGAPDLTGLPSDYAGSIELRDGVSDNRVYIATSNQVVQAAAETYTNATIYTDNAFTNTWNAAQKWVFTLTDGTVITNEVLTRGVQ